MAENQFTVSADYLAMVETRHFEASQVPPTGLVLTPELAQDLKHSGVQDWRGLAAAMGWSG